MNENTILIRSSNATFQVVDGEAILIRMDTGHYYSLNGVATTFWELLDGKSTVAELASTITLQYNQSSAEFSAGLRMLAEQADTDDRVDKATELAERYGVEPSLVLEKLPLLAGPEADVRTADLLENQSVALESVTADLLELTEELVSEKLVEIAG